MDPISWNDALYLSFVTFTTLGYGVFQLAQGTRLLAAFQALCGYCYLGLGVGLASNGFVAARRCGDGSRCGKHRNRCLEQCWNPTCGAEYDSIPLPRYRPGVDGEHTVKSGSPGPAAAMRRKVGGKVSSWSCAIIPHRRLHGAAFRRSRIAAAQHTKYVCWWLRIILETYMADLQTFGLGPRSDYT